jgi:hypothetical protein
MASARDVDATTSAPGTQVPQPASSFIRTGEATLLYNFFTLILLSFYDLPCLGR